MADDDKTGPGGLSATMKVGIAAAALLIAVAAFVFLRGDLFGDPELAKLERLVAAASTACASNTSDEKAAKVGADLGLLLDKVKGEGGISEYRKKHSGASQKLPPELQLPENREIRECMSRYMPAILETIGIKLAPQKDSAADLPNPLQLRFSYARPEAASAIAFDETLRVNLQSRRHVVPDERLAQQAAGHYSTLARYPDEGEEILGTLAREIRASSTEAAPKPAMFCVKRPASLQPSAERHVHLDCTEGQSCTMHFPSPAWLEICPVKVSSPARDALRWLLLPEARAAEPARRWSVPSARTLALHEGERVGVGYTIFDIETDALRDPGLIGVEVELSVNGVTVNEDGLAAALRPVPAVAGKPFAHRFALESLDFEGAQGGCEAVLLTLTPRLAGGGKGAPVGVTLAYVALRDKARTTVPIAAAGAPGASLTWQARYVIPPAEWSHEAFITSVAFDAAAGDDAAARARAQSAALKQDFDRLGLAFRGQPLVAVIRPPLTPSGSKLAYGLAAGVIQASGQVRFTFSYDDAGALADTLLAARGQSSAARRTIGAEKYVYRVAGNRERQDRASPPGVCKHVKTG